MKPVVVIYGGSFNPPTLAHVAMVEAVLRIPHLEYVVVEPVNQHAYGKALLPYEERRHMTVMAFKDLIGSSKVMVTSLDGNAFQTAPAGSMYSFCKKFQEWIEEPKDIRILIGADQAQEVYERWHRGPELVKDYGMIVVPRGDRDTVSKDKCPWLYEGDRHVILDPLDKELWDVSSTAAREAAGAHHLVKLTGMLSKDVAGHVVRKDLYKTK